MQDLLQAAGNADIIIEQGELIANDLSMKGFAVDGETNQVLIRHLAAAYVNRWFSDAYAHIYGGQIRLMKEAGYGLSKDKALRDAKESMAKYPQVFGDTAPNQYLDYLLDHRLIQLNGETYQLTPRGRAFIDWMKETNRPEDRPF